MALVEYVIVLLDLQLQQVLAQMEGELKINKKQSVTSIAYIWLNINSVLFLQTIIW